MLKVAMEIMTSKSCNKTEDISTVNEETQDDGECKSSDNIWLLVFLVLNTAC